MRHAAVVCREHAVPGPLLYDLAGPQNQHVSGPANGIMPEDRPEGAGTPRHNSWREASPWAIGVVVVGLLLVIAAGQYLVREPMEELDLKPWEKAQFQPSAAEAADESPAVTIMPEALGSEDAPIEVGVYIKPGDPCHTSTMTALVAMADEYPHSVRIVFHSMSDRETKLQADRAGISCEAGITINGKASLTWEEGGETRTVSFNGPVGEHDYTAFDLRQAIEHLIREGGSAPGAETPQDNDAAAESG